MSNTLNSVKTESAIQLSKVLNKHSMNSKYEVTIVNTDTGQVMYTFDGVIRSRYRILINIFGTLVLVDCKDNRKLNLSIDITRTKNWSTIQLTSYLYETLLINLTEIERFMKTTFNK